MIHGVKVIAAIAIAAALGQSSSAFAQRASDSQDTWHAGCIYLPPREATTCHSENRRQAEKANAEAMVSLLIEAKALNDLIRRGTNQDRGLVMLALNAHAYGLEARKIICQLARQAGGSDEEQEGIEEACLHRLTVERGRQIKGDTEAFGAEGELFLPPTWPKPEGSAEQPDCRFDSTQLNFTECMNQRRETAERALTDMAEKLRSQLEEYAASNIIERETAQLVRSALEAWRAYRDAECRFLASASDAGGSTRGLAFVTCSLESTVVRLERLAQSAQAIRARFEKRAR